MIAHACPKCASCRILPAWMSSPGALYPDVGSTQMSGCQWLPVVQNVPKSQRNSPKTWFCRFPCKNTAARIYKDSLWYIMTHCSDPNSPGRSCSCSASATRHWECSCRSHTAALHSALVLDDHRLFKVWFNQINHWGKSSYVSKKAQFGSVWCLLSQQYLSSHLTQAQTPSMTVGSSSKVWQSLRIQRRQQMTTDHGSLIHNIHNYRDATD